MVGLLQWQQSEHRRSPPMGGRRIDSEQITAVIGAVGVAAWNRYTSALSVMSLPSTGAIRLTEPTDYESVLQTLPHITEVCVAPWPEQRFQATLQTRQGRHARFLHSTLQGFGYLAIEEQADQLWLHSFLGYRNLVWQTPKQTLYQASLPLLLNPHVRYQVSSTYRNVLLAGLSVREILAEMTQAPSPGVPGAWVGDPDRTPFLTQGRPRARLQCRRILEDIAVGMANGMSETSLALLERSLVTTIAHHWNPDQHRVTTHPYSRHVTRAIDWMQEHLSQPFPWSDLCRYVGVAQRTLEIAFQRELQLSPNRWLKQERLRSLRQRLQDAEESVGVPLAQLFESCGLPYCGTSQRAYNHLYGETPAHTRHRVTRK